MMSSLICLLSAFGFRVRGGLRIPFTDKKFPLNKFWWSVIFAVCAKYLYQGDWNFFWVTAIAVQMSVSICGWGEAVGCALGLSKPTPDRVDYADFDEFCDNFHIGNWKLIDHPICWGVVWLTLRGVFLSFFIGLALNNIPFMLCGALMGIIYAICGWIGRKIFKKYDKTFWNVAEWCVGAYFGLCLILCSGW